MTDSEIIKIIASLLQSRVVISVTQEASVEPVKTIQTRKWSTKNKKGRVPGWVIKATGINERRALEMAYGLEANFTEGEPLPKKL